MALTEPCTNVNYCCLLYFRLHCKILEVKAPLHHNGMANGHAGNTDGNPIIISDSEESDLEARPALNR